MCGIAGFWTRHLRAAAADDSLRRMNAAICHRGPDDQGNWFDESSGVGFTHRRLSIIDLSPHGHQPKASHSGRFTISFNGEIYNFLALREDLRARGHRFEGGSDTEVLLSAFEEWGIAAALERCEGMFAFALWDTRERKLSLGRDRIGEKPLYYGWCGGDLVFASELKALRAYPRWVGDVNRDAVADFVQLGYVPGPQSIYAGIHKLPPGTIVTVAAGDGRLAASVEPYWSLKATLAGQTQTVARTDAEAVSALDELLRGVVRSEMVADVQVGAFLSGGIDSSLIVATMQAVSDRPARTFTIGFHEKDYDEAHHAKAVAQHLGTEHTELYVSPDTARAVIPRLPALYDEPFADPSQIPTFLVSELARRHVTVSLSGDGGDELFGGYNRYFHWPRIAVVPRPIRTLAAHGLTALSPGSWDAIAARALPRRYRLSAPGHKAHKLAHVLRASSGIDAYSRLISHWPRSIVLGQPTRPAPLADIGGSWDAVSRMMYADTLSYLPDDILVKVDRASMAVGLESRAPLLHHRIVEFAWSLPLQMKVRDGRGKWILRALLDKYVPRSLIDRPKMGFGVPIDSWLRGPLRDWAEDLLDTRRLREQGLLDADAVREKWNEHSSGRRNWQYLLWDVLMLQAWYAAQ